MENLHDLIAQCKTEKQILHFLDKQKIPYYMPDGYDYFNIYIPINETEKMRIYKPYKGKSFVVQRMQKAEFKYSGIPVFMPSGKDTLQ